MLAEAVFVVVVVLLFGLVVALVLAAVGFILLRVFSGDQHQADEDARREAEDLAALAAERVRTQMRERLMRARPRARDDQGAA